MSSSTHIIYLGLDVQKDSITMAVLPGLAALSPGSEHFRAFHAAYEERFAATHGDWRPVVREVSDKFLACGVLEHGLARVRCDACTHECLASA